MISRREQILPIPASKTEGSRLSGLRLMFGTVYSLGVYEGLSCVKVLDQYGELVGGENLGPDGWEDGTWIPLLFPFLQNLTIHGPISTGDSVAILYPEDKPAAGFAILAQKPGEITTRQVIETDIQGPFLCLCNTGSGLF